MSGYLNLVSIKLGQLAVPNQAPEVRIFIPYITSEKQHTVVLGELENILRSPPDEVNVVVEMADIQNLTLSLVAVLLRLRDILLRSGYRLKITSRKTSPLSLPSSMKQLSLLHNL